MTDPNSRIARDLLARVDRNIVPEVKRNDEIVRNFAGALQRQINSCNTLLEGAEALVPEKNLLQQATFMHGGSAYEGLCITKKTDFDILIVLNKPYIFTNFEVVRDSSKFFCLRWKRGNGLSDGAGYLHAAELQSRLFDELIACINRIGSVTGIKKVDYKKGLAAINLYITTDRGTNISVDLAPQIAARKWGECPDLTSLYSLPSTLQDHVRRLECNGSPIYFFSSAVPGRHDNQHRLCNISFSMLEKEFLRSNTDVRDMVRLVKLVGEACEWKKYGLKSFLIKRVAVKYCSDLQTKTLWDGFRALLAHIWKELETNTIDGFFVKDQPVYQQKPHKVAEFRAALAEAHGWSAEDVRRKLELNCHCTDLFSTRTSF